MSLNEQRTVPTRSIVVLDDSATVLATVRMRFAKLGFDVITATDAAELDPESLHRASLVVVDVQMEQVFGDDVVQFLRENWQVKAPIYLYSSLPIAELERRAQSSGASGAVCKADGLDALVAKVSKVLEGL